MKENINQFYNKYYKLILIIPLVLLILSISIVAHTYITTGEVMKRDISLTGGTTITVLTDKPSSEFNSLLEQIPDLEIRSLLDSTGKQTQVILLTSKSPQEITPILESFLGFKLSEKNSSVEFTGSNLSGDFYKQLLIAVILAFFWMAAVVFIIFVPKWKLKWIAIILNIIFGIFLGKFFLFMNFTLAIIIFLIFVAALVFIYIKYSIPAFAVMLCAFADIFMTLAVTDLIGMKISGAGIVAFLMLIGYSVDTDILLTTRVLRRKGTSVNSEIFGAFKTGMTMTLTAIAAISVALIFVYSFGTSLNQIFTILLIGLGLDILNTWLTNTSLIKWFIESKEKSTMEFKQ